MLNERIKELRVLYKMNQIEFGKKLGVTKQCVSNWENNNIQPSVDMDRIRKKIGRYKTVCLKLGK